MSDQASYQKYLKAALKFTLDPKKQPHLAQRPVLEGVLHHSEGSLIASDSLRIIRIQGAHDWSDGAVLTKDGKDIRDLNYPDFSKIMSPSLDVQVDNANVEDWLIGHELMDILVADRVDEKRLYEVDGKKKSAILKNHLVRLSLTSGYPSVMTASWDAIGSGRHEFSEHANYAMRIAYNAQMVITSLKVLKSLGHQTCTLRFKSAGGGYSLYPFVIEAGNVWIMQMPLKFQ